MVQHLRPDIDRENDTTSRRFDCALHRIAGPKWPSPVIGDGKRDNALRFQGRGGRADGMVNDGSPS